MNYLLFTTITCPKCPAVKQFVAANVTFPGETVDNTRSDFMELAGQHGVSVAPTFIVFDNGNEVFRGNEASEIDSFLKK
jgi:hypothetical protein